MPWGEPMIMMKQTKAKIILFEREKERVRGEGAERVRDRVIET